MTFSMISRAHGYFRGTKFDYFIGSENGKKKTLLWGEIREMKRK